MVTIEELRSQAMKNGMSDAMNGVTPFSRIDPLEERDPYTAKCVSLSYISGYIAKIREKMRTERRRGDYLRAREMSGMMLNMAMTAVDLCASDAV